MRCYDGCPDAELQAVLDDTQKAHEELDAMGLRAVWFPMEGAWLVFDGLHSVGEFQPTVRAAANAAKGV